MEIIDGKIVLGTEPCHCTLGPKATPGKQPGRRICPACNGTRRGKRGGRGGCRQCLDGRTHDFNNLVDCGACNGTAVVAESLCSTITKEQWQGLTFKVIRDEKGRFGFNESYLGLGYVSCVTDYGTAWRKNDAAALLEEVRKESYVQATKIAKPDGTVCDHIAILVSPQGYKVKAVFAGDDPADNRKADAQVKAMFDPRGLATAEMLTAMEQGR